MTGCHDQALLWLLHVCCMHAGCVPCRHVCRGVACRTHIRRCFHIDFKFNFFLNGNIFIIFFLNFICEISIMMQYYTMPIKLFNY